MSVDLRAPLPATPDDLQNEEYTSPSAMVDSSDEVVIALAHQIDASLEASGVKFPTVRASPLPPAVHTDVAYALRDLVHSHISSKHLSTAYASASETARTGSGDCTEHAVLLAALLKAKTLAPVLHFPAYHLRVNPAPVTPVPLHAQARGIPARVCHGLVYVERGGGAISGEADPHLVENSREPSRGPGGGEGANDGARHQQTAIGADGLPVSAGDGGQYGWHMWSQALIKGRWVDLDATLHVPYSVGHVLVGTSSMSDKEAHNNHMQMAALIGNLEIELLAYSHEWHD